MTPKETSTHEYVLMAINYFTKWVETISYAKITLKHMVK